MVAVAIGVLVPGHSPSSTAPSGNEGPAQLASSGPGMRLTAADRRALDAALDAFIPAAMERRNAAAAWALAGPELKAGSKLSDWRTGSSPVPYYQPRETTFHHWSVIDVEQNSVIFNLLLHPKRKSVGSYDFSGEFVKAHGRWLVNRLYTVAIMKPPTHSGPNEVGPADFAAPPSAARPEQTKSVLGGIGILPAVGILALVLLVPITLGGVALLRARRWRRETHRRNAALPPLPSGYLPMGGEARGSSEKQLKDSIRP